MIIIPGIHVIKLGFVNSYLIEESDSLTLIDCGIPLSGKKINNYIKNIGRSIKDLNRIIITHCDADHIGALAHLKHLSGAIVYSSEIEAEGIKLGQPTRMVEFKGLRKFIVSIMSKFFKIKPAEVDKCLKDGDEIPVLGGLQAVDTIGHTPGHFSYYLKSLKVLFAGDSIISIDDKLYSSNPVFTWDAHSAAESFKKQALLEPAIVCCGHGEVVINAQNKSA